MTAKWAVAFDVDSIQDYVFASHRPVDVMGASLIVEDLAEEVQRRAGSGVVFAGGGNGLVLVSSETEAQHLKAELESYFFKATLGGGTLSTAAVACGSSDASTWRDCQVALRLVKATRAFRSPSVLIPDATPPAKVCQACGREVATSTLPIGDTQEAVGEQCKRRRERGRQTGQSTDLEALFESSQGLLGTVYLDGDGVGSLLTRSASFHELGQLARKIRSATKTVVDRAASDLGLGKGRYLAPVAGGDDVLVFIDGQETAGLLEKLWQHLSCELADIWFSAAVVLGPRRSPLRVLLDEAHWAMGEAKRQALQLDRPALAVALTAGRRSAAAQQLLFGGPLPSSRLAELVELVNSFARVEPAQRAGMASEVADRSWARAELALDYRATRNEQVSHALEKARDFTSPGSGKDLLATVASALALADEWGKAS